MIRRSSAGATAVAAAATVACIMPIFLMGALAVQVTKELSFGIGALGLAIGSFRAASAVASVPLGRAADRMGAIWALRVSLATATAAGAGIYLLVSDWLSLVACLAVAGCANAMCQPAANRLLAGAVKPTRLGTAFGIKQSAPPAAALFAGVSVPLIALTAGWRTAFLAPVALAAIVAFAAGRRTPVALRTRRRNIGNKLGEPATILLCTLGFGLGTAASSMAPAFYVDAAVRSGKSPATAGAILAVASGAAIATRVLSGVAADRLARRHLWLCAGLLGAGTFGLGLLGIGSHSTMTIGLIVAMAGTWGFNGIFIFALVRAFPHSPGGISGAVATGGLLGGAVGPSIYGILAEQLGYSLAWSAAALTSALAAGAMSLAAPRLDALGQRRPAPPN